MSTVQTEMARLKPNQEKTKQENGLLSTSQTSSFVKSPNRTS